MSQRPNARCPIAVVGVSALFPGSVDKSGFWNDILAGTDLISDVPQTHWLIDDYYDDDLKKPDHTYAKRGGFLKDVPFDALAWGVPPSILPATDTSQLLALIVAQRVLEDAYQGQFTEADKSRISVILGVTSAQELLGSMVSRLQHPIWLKSFRDAGLPESQAQDLIRRIESHYSDWQESTFPGLLGNVVAGRICNRLDLGGTNCVTDAACASAFSAVSMAVNELYLGDSDVVVCGGVDTMNDIFMYMCFSKTPALSKSGDVRPFSEQGDGTMLGEGIGMVALKRLEDAERDGDRIYGVIQGVGSSSDGRSKSVYAPVSAGQSKALRRAYDRAGFEPSTIELIEAHGTGTVAGDAAEFGGLQIAFGEEQTDKKGWCALGSVKSQIGHTKAAAGSAGLFKAIMALHHKAIPPTIKVDAPNPKIDLDGPFYISTRTRPWVRGSDHARRAGVSSFGFGGSNFHVALEEYTGANKAARLRTTSAEVVVLTADTPAALSGLLREHEAACREHGMDEHRPSYLAWMAHDTAAKLDVTKSARIALIAKDDADLAAKLGQAAGLVTKQGETAVSTPTGIHYAFGASAGEVAFLFPGQGSQYLDMGSSVARFFDEAIAAWDAAADVDLGAEADLAEVVFPRPGFDVDTDEKNRSRLTATEWAQPALGVSSVALLGLLDAAGVKPAMVGGHSYGEVTALHAAGVLSFEDMVRVARKRGELMREAAQTSGSMCAVPLEVDKVRAHLAEWGVDVVVANHNAPTQVVLSGATEAIADVEKRFAGVGITAKRLNVATAFHSSIVSPSTKPFGTFLDDVKFGKASVPVYANSQAAPYPKTAKAMRKVLAGQIAESVRFVEQVEAMYEAGARTFVEVGSGRVLSNLVGQILDGRDHVAVNLDHKRKDGVVALFEGLGRLAVAGVPVNLVALWSRFDVPADPKAFKAPKMAVDINGSNYGKPYPPADLSTIPGPNPEKPKLAPVAVAPAPAPKPVAVPKPAPVAAAPAPKPAPAPVAAKPAPVVAKPAPVVATPAPAPVVRAAAPSSAWLNAYAEAQKQTAEAHAAYQNAMADAHMSYLQAVETSFFGMTAMLQGGLPAPQLPASVPALPAPAPTMMPVAAAPAPVAVVPTPAPAPVPVQAPVVPVSKSMSAAPGIPLMGGADLVAATRAPKPVSVPKPAPAPVAKPAGIDLTGLLLAVVAEKTGYPSEMLDLGMELESDLGIDSIKRVEILSGMREKAPELPEVDASEMAELQTLAQIVDYMAAQGVSVASAPAAAPATSGIDLTGLLLEVVAEKTGYPSEMLNLDMELESDLGIDSIKRVEILSGMREKAPELPEVDASEMAELQTLAQIVDYMAAQGVSVATAPAAAPATSGIDLTGLLLEVVAEKTGYPPEMLDLGMELESDLGIDSIKRVEILSGMREKAPELPEVDASEMAELQTLAQIVDYMAAQGVSVATAPAAGPVVAAATAGIDLTGLLLEVVAEKTGYPADMLNLEMELESDLGIDSIKRVEILSGMREKAPSLPEVDASEMAELQTLQQIVDYMAAQGGGVAAAATVVPSAPALPIMGGAELLGMTAPAAKPVAAPAGIDLTGLLLEVVAEKTGYPADMLNLEMELESDLGIDSIKRVEILSGMREKAPSLPEVDASEMAELQTLQQIVDYMAGQSGAVAVAPAAPAAVGIDLTGLLLEVVAEKTGYPADMLNLEMELESDLGIDSIKRVEILSGMREKAPSLPEVDASEMAELQTLQQIVDYMGAQSGGATVASAPAVQAPVTMPENLGRFVLDLVPAAPAGFLVEGLDRGTIAVTRDGQGVAEALVARLNAAGLAAEAVDTVPAGAASAIFLGGLAEIDGAGARAVNKAAFAAAKAIAPRLADEGGAFVTVQDTGGDFGLSGAGERAWLGGLPGLIKTAAQEWTHAGLKAIDIARGGRRAEAIADALLAELLTGGAEREVGLAADGTRSTLKSAKVSVEGIDTGVVDGNSVIVASGGARGVTASTLIALAKATGAKFALLGRTALTDEPSAIAGIEGDANLKKALLQDAMARGEKVSPADLGKRVSRILANREIRSTLAAIAAVGGEAEYVACSVTDVAGLRTALDGVRAKWGPITGLVHGAGVLADRYIVDKTQDQFDFVFDTKVEGLVALLDALASDPLTLLVNFSSVAARAGNQGQCDYAMANEVLNKVAAAEGAKRPGMLVKSLGWGPWEGGMVTPALKARFESLGVALIPLEVGAKMLVDEVLSGARERVELVLGGEPKPKALLSASAADGATYMVRVQAATHGFLTDHSVEGEPVVPVVLAMEWMAQAALALRPDYVLARIEDVVVAKGIRVSDFAGQGSAFTLHARQLSNGNGASVAVDILGAGGLKHYTATVVLSDRHTASAGARALSEPRTKALRKGAFYTHEAVFHGPKFQVVGKVAHGEGGMVADLSGTAEMGWDGGAWVTDPALLDGALQLALYFTSEALGQKSLPTGIGSVHIYRDLPVKGSVRCVLAGKADSHRSLTDILITNGDGAPVVELRGVSTFGYGEKKSSASTTARA